MTSTNAVAKKAHEGHSNSFINCLSLGRHTTATEYDEIVAFAKRSHYYAVKAEDTVTTENSFPEFQDAYDLHPGMVHVHWLQVFEEIDKAPADAPIDTMQFGAKRKSRFKTLFFKHCPTVAKALLSSHATKKYGFMCAHMTNEHAAVYFSKETTLRCTNLPDDLCVLRPYISIKQPRVFNVERTGHVNEYERRGNPMPPTAQSITDYFNHRWFVANDLATPAMPQHRDNIIESVYNAMVTRAVEVPKRMRAPDKNTAAKKPRICPFCTDDQPLGHYQRMCDFCSASRHSGITYPLADGWEPS